MSQEPQQTLSSQPQSHEDLVAEGRGLFDTLAASDSGVRGFSEATRENTSDTYNRVATAKAFEAGVAEDVDRLGQIAEKFAHVPNATD